jgi:Fe-S cluster assembly protein SufD
MATVVEQSKPVDHVSRYVSRYTAKRGRFASEPSWLTAARDEALARFTASGFPTTRDEDWRFTPVSPIVTTPFVDAEAAHVDANRLAPHLFGDAVAAELVFVNGRFSAALSRTENLPAGLEAGSLAHLIATRPEALEPWLTTGAANQGSAFTSLNTAFLEDGAFVEIARDTVIDRPVHVVFYSTGGGAPAVAYPRLLVVAGEHSEGSLIETYAGSEGTTYLTNTVAEFFVGHRAILKHYRVQRESLAAYHVGTQVVRTGRETVCQSHNLVLGGAIARNDVSAVLGGQGGDTTLNGLYLAGGTQLVDTHTTIDHALPHNGSHELYKGILGGKGRGVFNGKIIVRQDAQKTDAKQTNKALLLSDGAQIDTKPQLEIFADDVKCTHGATVGQLDPEMLFYLQARGISLADARALLILGFAGDVVNRVTFAPLRERLDHVVRERVEQIQAE